jgi:REP element-mobilizing transposase RayT
MKRAHDKDFLINKRRTTRPLSFKQSTHLVLRLKNGLPPLFNPRDQKLRSHILKLAQKYNIRVYQLIFNHSHLHGVFLLSNRTAYVQFIRELTGYAVQHFTSSLNIPGLIFRRIFSNRPFTRSVPWGRAYKTLLRYMKKNELESGVSQFIQRKVPSQLQFFSLPLPDH